MTTTTTPIRRYHWRGIARDVIVSVLDDLAAALRCKVDDLLKPIH